MQFDGVMANYGNGYVESGDDHGKFIAPYNDTYTFTVSLRNQDQWLWLYADIRQIWEGGFKNLCRVKSNDLNSNQERQMAGCTTVVKLTAGDVVAVVNNDIQDSYYSAGYTTFSGHLLKRDI